MNRQREPWGLYILVYCLMLTAAALKGIVLKFFGVIHYTAMVQWVSGFLSAYNVYHEKDINIPDGDTIGLFVSEYCRKHPLDYLLSATEALITQLGGRVPHGDASKNEKK